MSIVPVILSGGSGTRLWPLSRSSMPKQFIPLVSERTMIQETVLRLKGVKTADPIVVCNEQHRYIVAEQFLEIGIQNPSIILEPVARNTAPAIAAACLQAQKSDPDAVVVVLPSDHNIKDIDVFAKAIETAGKEALNNSLVTFGIKPTFVATGYGYIQAESDFSKEKVLSIKKFVEKPDLETAKSYLESGDYSWNSGMFIFKAGAFLEELKALNPAVYEAATKSFDGAKVSDNFIYLQKEAFLQSPSISIDYAVMEKTTKGKVVSLDAGWSDVGSWSSLWDISQKDADGNVLQGEAVAIGAKNSLVRCKDRVVALVGLSDVVVIDTKDALLVASKDKSEKVKDVVEALKAKNNPVATKYLD